LPWQSCGYASYLKRAGTHGCECGSGSSGRLARDVNRNRYSARGVSSRSMSADIGHASTSATHALWQVEAAQLLEEHHLVGWAHHPKHRRRFADDLACSLASMDDTQVCLLPGNAIRDIFSFCNFLERSIRNDRVRRSIDAK